MKPLMWHYITELIPLFYVLAIAVSVHVLLTARSPQTALAWIISFLTFPYISLLLYFFFGRNRFWAYAEAMQKNRKWLARELEPLYKEINGYVINLPPPLLSLQHSFKKIYPISFTTGNRVTLLIDGQSTYKTILKAIEDAKAYILFQFYIIRNDPIGLLFEKKLIEKAQEGLKIYFLHDEWGTRGLSKSYLNRLKKAGVLVASFRDAKRDWRSYMEINFRNHRKIVVIDGEIAFTGGLNIGEEYLGHKKKLGPWRDTHVALKGPALQSAQISFFIDWYWATRTALKKLRWIPSVPEAGNQAVLVLPTGPDHPLQTGTVLLIQLINLAQKRLWMASAYFVPDATIIKALQLAVLRGVEVRILLPDCADHWIVYLCSFSYYEELRNSGIQLFRYKKGFLHEKIVLIDHSLASVGTLNLDNRSLYINFEITVLVAEHEFVNQVEAMLKHDFSNANPVDFNVCENWSYPFKIFIRFIRLLAPLL